MDKPKERIRLDGKKYMKPGPKSRLTTEEKKEKIRTHNRKYYMRKKIDDNKKKYIDKLINIIQYLNGNDLENINSIIVSRMALLVK